MLFGALIASLFMLTTGSPAQVPEFFDVIKHGHSAFRLNASAIGTPIRGVNIGGWLVLEPWITPSLFQKFHPIENVVDQWSFCATLGQSECTRQLEAHHGSFFTEQDVAVLAKAGITHFRIPVGYWLLGNILPGEPWVLGDEKHLFAALDWADKYGVKVVVDLHCGPGSQNGFDNSGKRGEIHWADPARDAQGNVYYPNVDRTLAVLGNFSAAFGNRVWAIEMLNEPFPTIDANIVLEFYQRAYRIIRANAPEVNILMHDSFRFAMTQVWLEPPTYTGVFIDTHTYQVFDAYRLKFTWDEHMHQTCTTDRDNVALSDLWAITGEWSLATTDCAKWLNGYNVGARYDGTYPGSSYIGSCEGRNTTDGWGDDYKQFLKQYAERQMDAYETGNGTGWFFWNFKTEQAPQWNYLLGLSEGWIPTYPTQREFECPP